MVESAITDEARAAMAEKLKSMSPDQIAQLQKEQCIFCSIISGKIPAKKIYEDKLMVAILDINPAAKGHLLLIPKNHYMILPHVPDSELAHLFLVAQKLSQSVLRTFKVGGTTIFIANGQVAGQRAQHVMVHVIPRKEGDKVMAFEEKLIGSEMAAKVQMAVKPTFYKHLGIGEMSSRGSADVENKERGSTPTAGKHVPEPKNGPPKKVAPKQLPTKGDGSTVSLRQEEDVSLDDIANLFK